MRLAGYGSPVQPLNENGRLTRLSATIADYYRAAIEHLKAEVESTPDDRILGMDLNEWVDYLIAKFGMKEIVLDNSRTVRLIEAEHGYTSRRYDIYSDAAPGTVTRSTAIRVQVPVIPSDTLGVISAQQLSSNPFSGDPEFEYDDQEACLWSIVHSTIPADVKRGIESITEAVQRYNGKISGQDQEFRPRVVQIVTAKRNRVTEKHKKLDDLVAAVGIPLTRKADLSSVVPTAPKCAPRSRR